VFDIYFIVSLIIFSVLCFFELIVFNEEILLALCFFSFIFFSFNTLGDSVFDTFQSRAEKFEAELLISFEAFEENLNTKFNSFTTSQDFVSKHKALSHCVTNCSKILISYYSYNGFIVNYTTSVTKLMELTAFESKLKTDFHEKCVSLLLYPLIFQTPMKNTALLANAAASKLKASKSAQVSVLTLLSK
jgi:hypothetical protein